MRVLVAEDERITRATLARQLEGWGHEVTAVENGEVAWARCSEESFDVVLTDWEMPRLSGVELVKRIRASGRPGFVYVIMLTSRADKTDVVQGIEAGADDFVTKPFDKEELRVRLLAGERIVQLERALAQQNLELKEAGERIRADLRAAARMQSAMLPAAIIQTPSVRTAWRYVPTDELAGDGIGLHLIDGRYLVAYVLDVSGHGVPAALLSVSTMHALAPEPAEASVMRDLSGSPDAIGTVRAPASIANELNRRFPSERNDGRFMTLSLCVVDLQTGVVHAASAGHPPNVLVRAGKPISTPDVGGLPLCLMEGHTYDGCRFELRAGDRLCLMSDGLIEQLRTDSSGRSEQFGLARLTGVLAETSEPIEDVADATIAALTAWTGAKRFDDDVSLVIIEWLGAGG